jgi:predicted hotdog family 3-hydroxylacyl-ACP dehydratase
VIADRRRIEELLPHGPGMVLLDRVLSSDGGSILCAADSHRDPDNPLWRHGRLPAMAAIEYAAQAAALHGALSGHRAAGAGAVLGGVKDLKATVQGLDEIGETLAVRATLLLAQVNGAVYSFEVGPQSGAAVVEGRFTAMYK